MKHKRILPILLAGCLAINFAACTKEPGTTISTTNEPISTDTSFADGIYILKTVSKDTMNGNTLLAQQSYDELYAADQASPIANALQTFNENEASICANESQQMAELANSDFKDSPERFQEMYYSYERSLSVRRADELLVSVLITEYSFYGGVHPNTVFYGQSWDKMTGTPLVLSDVLKDTSSLPATLSALISEKYPETHLFVENLEEYLTDCLNEKEREDGSKYSLSWTYDYSGLVFYFSPYELASYADGLLTVSLDTSVFGSLYQDKYLYIPESYAFPVGVSDEGMPTVEYDFDSESYVISFNGKVQAVVPQTDEYPHLFFAHTNNQNYTILRFKEAGSDNFKLSFYKLENASLVKCGDFDGDLTTKGNTGNYYLYLPINPEDFMLKSSDGKVAHYKIGANGLPEKN